MVFRLCQQLPLVIARSAAAACMAKALRSSGDGDYAILPAKLPVCRQALTRQLLPPAGFHATPPAFFRAFASAITPLFAAALGCKAAMAFFQMPACIFSCRCSVLFIFAAAFAATPLLCQQSCYAGQLSALPFCRHMALGFHGLRHW